MREHPPRPRRLVPETVQTSGMDCGPAALRSLLAGMGVPASYGRLREACQTDVDGTAIEALEETARALGLDVAQLMLPADHVAVRSAGALPALAVSVLPNGMPHFVIAWARHGPLVQVMDPATGRRFVRARGLESLLYIHQQPVPAAAWAAFSESPAFRQPLTDRLQGLVGTRRARELVTRAADAGPRAMAALDAQARAASADGRRPAAEALERAVADPDGALERLDPEAWFARPIDAPTPGDEPLVLLRGAVVVRARGHSQTPPDPAQLTPELRAALTEPAPRPARRLLDAARAQGRVPVRALLAAAVLLAAGTIAEEALLRHAVNARTPGPVLAAIAGLAALLLVVDVLSASAGLAIGRRLEVGLRHALLAKLPRLPDRYLTSRPPSDMADRAHLLHELRVLPLLAVELVSAAGETVLVAFALCVLDPAGTPLVIAATVLALAVAWLVQWPLREREQRQREHSSALGQITLDALLGGVAIRAHGGEGAMWAEQRDRQTGWQRAANAANRARALATFAQTACAVGLTIPVVVSGLSHVDDFAGRLLLVLWAISIPFGAERLGRLALQWPGLRTLALRLAEPLDAPETPGADAPAPAPRSKGGGVEVTLDGATVRATGHPVLHPTSLRLAAGEHVALVGTSGAGKSTLCSLVLGLAEPSDGRVLVDGAVLDRAAARGLWPHVAWVDSQVRVWNRPLGENLAPGADPLRVAELVDAAELEGVAGRVGDQPLGTDGGLLSGGEAQRVRLGRAFARPAVRLAILDEALRGLDRDQRHRLLQRARERWREATVLCATHDVQDALEFDRVLVMEGGRVVQDGPPQELLSAPDSPLRALLDAEHQLRAQLYTEGGWRRLRIERGTLVDDRSASIPAGGERDAAVATREDPDPAGDPAGSTPPLKPALGWLVEFVAFSIARFVLFIASWRQIGDAILTPGDVRTGPLTAWALLLCATVPLGALASWAQGHVGVALGSHLRHRVLAGALALDPSWTRKEGPGRVLGRSMEVDAVTRLSVAGGLDALTSLVQLVLAAVVLLSVQPGRAAAAMLAGVLLLTALTAALAAIRRARWTAARLAETDELLEAIAGQRTRLIQGGDDEAEHRARLDRYRELSHQADRPLAQLAGALPRATMIAGLAGLGFTADTTHATYLAVAVGGMLLAVNALRQAAMATNSLATAALARSALKPILDAAPTTGVSPDRTPATPASSESAAGRGGLAVRGLSVDRDGRRVLHGIDLHLAAGEHAILTGVSGAGKSTFAATLAGLLDASDGHVAVDHAHLASAGSQWHSRVQLVPQHNENHILLAPLAFNLLLGRRWPPAPDDLRAATEMCQELELGPLLQRMPAGIGQHVGETGWRLSQGERARVQLARALLADPDVLLLDEPLGALDPGTARLVLDVVRRRARTLVLISQE